MSPLKELVVHFQGRHQFPIKVDDVRDWIIERGYQDEISIYKVDVDEEILKGFVRQYTYSNMPYGAPIRATTIGYSRKLNKCWERYVCCKELVHILDSGLAGTATGQEIETLTQNLSTLFNAASFTAAGFKNLPDDYVAETWAYVTALFVLVPLDAVEQLRSLYNSGSKKAYDIALFFRIPVAFVDFIFSNQYKELVETFMEDEEGQKDKGVA